jgi:nucleoside-diphosphate-sugar epimerase
MPTSTELRVGVLGADSFLGAHLVPAIEAKGWQAVPIVSFTRAAAYRGQCRTYDPLDGVSVADALDGCPVAIEASCWRPKGLGVAAARGEAVRRARALMLGVERAQVTRCVVVSDLSTIADRDGADASDFYVPGTTDNAVIEASRAFEAEIYYGVSEGLDLPIVIPAMMVGPRDTERACGLMVGLRDETLPVLPEGNVEIVDVRDLARAVATAVESGRSGRRYPVSAGAMTTERLARVVVDRFGSSMPRIVSRDLPAVLARGLEAGMGLLGKPISLERPLRHVRQGRVRDTKARGELSFVARPLDQTVSDALDWYADAFGWTAEN